MLANSNARLMVLGGEPMDGPRHIWWNFVASSRERIQAAKADWASARSPDAAANLVTPFPPVPGDDVEFTPAPQ